MSNPTCHVLCERRGSRLCQTGELSPVKVALEHAITAQQSLENGDYVVAMRALEKALVAALDARVARDGEKNV